MSRAATAPGEALNIDQLNAVRRAVAGSCRQDNRGFKAEIEAGKRDDGPLMRAGIAAAEAVLKGLTDG